MTSALATILCATAVPFSIGWLLLRLVWPGRLLDGTGCLRLFLGCGLGIGVTSLLFFVQASVFGSTRTAPFAAELLVAAVLLGLYLRVRRRQGRHSFPDESRAKAPGWLWLLLGAAAAYAVVAFVSRTLGAPHGSGDAAWIWNVRARFLFHLDEQWHQSFAPATMALHADYPLLVPGQVARTWAQVASTDPLASASVGFVFTFVTAGLLGSTLAWLRSPAPGLVAATTLLATASFVHCGATQQADVPLAFFLLAAMALLAVADHTERDGTNPAVFCVLAGTCAGLAAWTKNEGLLCAVLLPLVRLATMRHRPARARGREILGFAAGAAPVLLVVLWFKSLVPEPNDLLGVLRSSRVLEHACDPERYATIARHCWRVACETGHGVGFALLAAAVLLGRGHDRSVRNSGGSLSLAAVAVLLGYCCVFLLTSLTLQWHLRTALDRLFLQVLPALMLGTLLLSTPPRTEP